MDLVARLRRPILVIYWLAIAVASHVPREVAVRMGVKLSGVMLHLSAYFVLTLLFWWNLEPSRNRSRSILVAATVLGGYAALDEWTQSFIRGRDGSFFDMLINWSGILLGIVYVSVLRPRALQRVGE